MAKTVGFLVCGKEADRYLEGTLKEFERLCDDVVVALCNSDEATKQMIKGYGLWAYEDNRVWGKEQPNIKTDLLAKVAKLKPEIIVPLDADEVFDASLTRDGLEGLFENGAIAQYFYIVNLWDDPSHYKEISCFWNIRAYSFRPELGLGFMRKNVHCGLAPPWAYYYGHYAPYIVKHYGLMKPEDRAHKVERYKQFDPKADVTGMGSYYRMLADPAPGQYFDEIIVSEKVKNEVLKMKQPMKKFDGKETPQKVYTLERGNQCIAVDTNPKHYLKQGWKVVAEVEFQSSRTVVNPPVVDRAIIECPLCGEQQASQEALEGHKTTHLSNNTTDEPTKPTKRRGRPPKAKPEASDSTGGEL